MDLEGIGSSMGQVGFIDLSDVKNWAYLLENVDWKDQGRSLYGDNIPVNYALMAISSSSSSSSSDSEINTKYGIRWRLLKKRDELKDKIAKWEESTKNLEEILKSQMSARDKTGLGLIPSKRRARSVLVKKYPETSLNVSGTTTSSTSYHFTIQNVKRRYTYLRVWIPKNNKLQLYQAKSKKVAWYLFNDFIHPQASFKHNFLKEVENEDWIRLHSPFANLFGQDFETFTGTMFLNMDQLQKALDNNEFQEIGSMASFKVLGDTF
ncbi:hypothetical protein Tco_0091033 [Tanacetum coccineum]